MQAAPQPRQLCTQPQRWPHVVTAPQPAATNPEPARHRLQLQLQLLAVKLVSSRAFVGL